MDFRKLLLLLLIQCFVCVIQAHWKNHYRYNKAADRTRWKRQFEGNVPTQIDLNITVPFIFSARLYPYGPNRGDSVLDPNAISQAFVLKHEITYFGRSYSVIHILRDGAIGFSPGLERHDRSIEFPRAPKAIAVFWTPSSLGQTGRVYFRETEDANILSLAKSEVQIQYRYGDSFEPQSVFIVTWENMAPPDAKPNLPNNKRNIFQIAMVLSKNGTFAHVVYSKIKWSNNAVAGFNQGNDGNSFFLLPGSGGPDAILLANQSDIGIPGEWLFKIDEYDTHLCGPGYTGIECIDRCEPGQWYYDCFRDCHCENNAVCNTANGNCPGACKGGWANPPVCDIDIDECEEEGEEILCPSVQPDCVNTPGAYLCMCLAGYDNATNICRGAPVRPQASIDTPATVRVVPFKPRIVTPRLILPHLLRTGPPRRMTPFIQSVGFTAKVDTLDPNLEITLAPQPVTPRTIRPVLQTNRPRGQSGPRFGTNAPTPRTIRPRLQTNGPRIDSNRPRIQTNAPRIEVNRPRIQTSRPRIQTNRPGIDDNRPGIDANRPGIQTNGPRIHTIRPNVIGIQQPATPHTVSRPDTQPPFSPTRGRIVSPGRTNIPPSPISGCTIECGNHAHCALNSGGIPNCVCDDGWSGDGQFCVDINECFLENACEGNSRCQNTLGGYNCICDEGFESDGVNCIDVDECQDPLLQCPGRNTSVCVNTHGSYECRCKEGYNGNPTSILGCIDINECLIPEFYCGQNADCENTQGGFICHCFKGFTRNQDASACIDVDECIRGPCDKAAICYNTPGSFKCSCIDGYGGDGHSCAETILFPFDRKKDKTLPKQPNSIVELPLSRPVTIFGKHYQKAYISANGIVSFDQPLLEYQDKPLEDMAMVGFSPLYMRNDHTLGGDIFFRETTDYSILTRSSLNIEEDFHHNDFMANSVLVITFDKVHSEGSAPDDKNTYQMVLISGDKGTYVSYIYDNISTRTAKAGILSPVPSNTVVLPGSATNSANLKLVSNIGQPGKWLFRVDQEEIIPCPAGMTGPPFCTQGCQPGLWGQNCASICRCANGVPCDFSTGHCSNRQCQPGYTGDNCQQDFDECETGENRCASKALCINTDGSYICQCAQGYTGDGYTCTEVDICHLQYGVPCGPNAICLLDVNNQPHCLCIEGFIGDGYRCTSLNTVDSSTQKVDEIVSVEPVTTKTVPQTLPPTTARTTEPPPPPTTTTETTTITPLVFTTRRRPTTTRRPVIDNRITAPTQRRRRPTTRRPTGSRNDIINNVITRGNARQNEAFETADTSNMLVIIIPAVLCGIWLILIVVLLAVCLRRRKQRQRSKYGIGYYMPPTSSNEASNTMKRSSSGAAASASTPQSGSGYYGSQWSIPRPTYDYYQGTYYPNPYTPYKF